MRKRFIAALWATTAAGALATGITIAAAQEHGGAHNGGGHPGGGPAMGGRVGGGAEMRGHVGGRGGMAVPSHGPSQGMTAGPMHSGPSGAGPGGGYAEHRGAPSSQFGGMREQHGHAFGQERNGGRAFGEQRSLRSDRGQIGEQRFGEERGRAFGENRGMRGREGVDHGNRYGYAHAGVGHVALSGEQRTRIRDVFVHHGYLSRYRVHDVDFDLGVGVRVPRWFHTFWVPQDVVLVAPEFEGYRCFVYEEELVIVDPDTLEIIAILPV